MMDTTDLVPTKATLSQDAARWSAHARDLHITDREGSLHASHLLVSIKSVQKSIAAWFAPHIEAAMDTKRKAEAARKGLADEAERMAAPLLEAERSIKRELLRWEQDQERIRAEEEARLQLAAQQEAERLTLDAAAAMEREATATGNEELLDEAHAILAQPIEAPVVSVAPLTPKVQGVTYRDNWKVHPDIGVRELAAAVGRGDVPVTFLQPNLSALNAFARATQGTRQIPGVRVYNDRQIAARG